MTDFNFSQVRAAVQLEAAKILGFHQGWDSGFWVGRSAQQNLLDEQEQLLYKGYHDTVNF